ncbi:MAG: hypothetical protein WC196_05105 [Bacilli bacterium]|jgi:hypothetical protein
MTVGNFAFGGIQRSYSFPNFHADKIPYSAVAVQCPNMECEQVFLQNDPDSGGNIVVGSEGTLPVTGNGFVLEPGDVTGWIPVNNLGLIWHKDAADSTLNYMIIW